MTFNEYQRQAKKTALYWKVPKLKEMGFVYPLLGLSGETGEVAEKLKKVLRDKNGVLDKTTRIEIKKEIGDVLWYVSQLCTELGIKLGDVAETNIEK